MKTKEELNALKKETEKLKGKLAELTDEALTKVSGGKIVLHDDSVFKPPSMSSPSLSPSLSSPTPSLSPPTPERSTLIE